MGGRRGPRFLTLAMAGSVLCVLGAVASAAQPAGAAAPAAGALVSVGSPTGSHPQNAQNEPALAVDPTAPNILAAGANDLVDMQPCSQWRPPPMGVPRSRWEHLTSVGLGGVYFSFNSGHSWIQPTYQGLTAADCSPTAEPCTPHAGPIHTVPNYFENGLRSRSDPGVAFGPVPVNGTFSYANGTRLYYANLATNLTDTVIQRGGINAATAIRSGHIDNLMPASGRPEELVGTVLRARAHPRRVGPDKEQVGGQRGQQPVLRQRVRVTRLPELEPGQQLRPGADGGGVR
jgi:hypothetical protein